MDALALIIGLLINGNALCSAQPAAQTAIGGETYQIQSWRCDGRLDGVPVEFRAWTKQCPAHPKPGEPTWWSRPFFLEETHSQQGLYLNRFAEVHTGWHVALDETYVPACVS